MAMLLHGGFYRSIWAADLMDALAADLAARGFAAWNEAQGSSVTGRHGTGLDSTIVLDGRPY